MDTMLLSEATQKVLQAYLRQPTHALMLEGLSGVGLKTIAHSLASSLIEKASQSVFIEPDKGLIPIERVRQLYQQTRSIQHARLMVVIDDCDAMSPDAQNALLKLFEEPTSNVHFILTTHRPTAMLQTITSRAQVVHITPISESESRQLLGNWGVESARAGQILFLASGLPAEMYRLAHDEAYFEQRSRLVKDARSLLQSAPYDRLLVLKNYSHRDEAAQLVTMCGRLLELGLVKQKSYKAVSLLPYVLRTLDGLQANGHVKTQLLAFVAKLG